MENPYQAPQSAQVEARAPGTVDRELPGWIRFFSWIFLVIGPLMVVGSVVGEFTGGQDMTYSFFGLSVSGGLSEPLVLYVLGLFALNSVAAYGLLWKTDWGLNVGLAAGALGLLTALASFVTVRQGTSGSGANFRLEPVFQVAFLISLWRRRKAWSGKD